jgi:hypothetical protein
MHHAPNLAVPINELLAGCRKIQADSRAFGIECSGNSTPGFL